MQDVFNKLFDGRSVGERGTLCDLKNDFNHKNVSTDVMNCFNHADNFVRFITEAHVVYLALTVCDMQTLDDKPSGWTDCDISDRFNHLCDQLLNEAWIHPSLAEIQGVLDCDADVGNFRDNWCICGEVKYRF